MRAVSGEIEICILAGGKSTRMGRDKRRATLDGLTMLEHSERIGRATGLLTRVIEQDVVEARGPISGIVTAFKTSRAKRILFLACDMPFVRAGTLLRLAEADDSAFASANDRAGFPFILQRRDLKGAESLQELAAISRAIKLQVPADEVFNINTPSELAAAEARIEREAREVVLDIDGVGIRRNGIFILCNVSWRVRRGEHWVMLGANGSGKTSLLAALTGYMSPTTGRFKAMGHEFGRADWRELRTRIGIVSSSLRQLMADGEPAIETVASGEDATIDRWRPAPPPLAKKARARLKQVGCEYLAMRTWACLSQGERQRVLIARALMSNPDALILDEPCAGLDPAAREHFLDFIQALTEKKNGPTLILVTHHVEEIMPGFTHVLALKQGRVIEAGPKRKVLNSALLSETFSCRANLRQEGRRYSLRVKSAADSIM